jgi:hypothetical protein
VKQKIILSALATLFACGVYAQVNVSLRYFGLTIHPFGDKQANLQPYKLDPESHFVLNFGGFAGIEKFVWQDIISIKVLQAFFTDCSAGKAGFTHLGVRGVLFENEKHRLLFGLGPTLLYREDWNRFPEYEDSGFFYRFHSRRFGDIQYYMFWYGAEFEYDIKVGERTDLNFGFTPGAPMALTFSAGVKYWINKDFKKREKLVIPR